MNHSTYSGTVPTSAGPAFNSHEEYSRGLKVSKLVQALDALGADVGYVRRMGPAEWAIAAHVADVKHPGEKTKAVVLAVYESRAANAGKSPLDGIGTRG